MRQDVQVASECALADVQKNQATLDEVQSALEDLASDSDSLLKLRHVAARFIFGTLYREPEDLVHDAIRSALELNRRWNQEQSFFNFLCGAMQSIASNDRTSLETRSERLASTLGKDEDVGHDEALTNADTRSHVQNRMADDAEQAAQAEKRRRADILFGLFSDDDHVTLILMAMEDGCRGNDIEQQCGLSPTEYATARRRMRRRLASAYPARKSS